MQHTLPIVLCYQEMASSAHNKNQTFCVQRSGRHGKISRFGPPLSSLQSPQVNKRASGSWMLHRISIGTFLPTKFTQHIQKIPRFKRYVFQLSFPLAIHELFSITCSINILNSLQPVIYLLDKIPKHTFQL